MAEPPSGTVTFLSTDIEGSTQLLRALGDDYAELLTKHRALLRSIFAEHGGYEVDSQGDAFLVAFPRAREAVAASTAVIRATAEGDIRLRIGIHSAEAIFTGEGYVGLGVHRAGRLCGAAHGGQVLLSQATRELLRETRSEGVDLGDLGMHRLKDLAHAQRVYQLLIPGLRAEFPPLRSLENRPTNLPIQPTPLIGREREIAEVTGLLRQADVRLLTLTGPAGTGKTRLALQAAAELLDDFADGVYFVGLAAVADPDLVMPTVARILGIREGVERLLVDAVHEYVKERELFLVFDNFEHLLGGAATVAELVAHAGRLKVLATSRAVLHLAAEHVYLVPPLETPAGDADVEGLRRVDSVALFVARARAARPEFALTAENARAVAGICKTLDGLPLALELAAARVAVLPPSALLDRLGDRLKLLIGGPRDSPARHQALRAAIEWSYDLLEPSEQALFARLSVFAGTCSLDGADQVLGTDALEGLTSLIDKSLIRLEGTDEKPRYRMLMTIREYALERLRESGDERVARDRHLQYYLQLAKQTYVEWLRMDHHEIAQLTAELDNLRAAADWAELSDLELNLELVGFLAWFWIYHTTIAEAQERLTAALGHTKTGSAARARATYFAAEAMAEAGRGEQALALWNESLAQWRELDDPIEASQALEGVGWGYFMLGEDVIAQQYFEDSLELRRELDDAFLIGRSLWSICQVLVSRGLVDEAEPMAQDLYRSAAEAADSLMQLISLHYLADCPLIRGDYGTAEKRYARASCLAWELGNRTQCALEMNGVAMAVSGRGEYGRALRLAGAAFAELEREQERRGKVIAIPFWTRLNEKHLGRAREALGPQAAEAAEAAGHNLALERALEEATSAACDLALADGDSEMALDLAMSTVELARAGTGRPGGQDSLASALNRLGNARYASGQIEAAQAACDEAVKLLEGSSNTRLVAQLQSSLKRLAPVRGHVESDRTLGPLSRREIQVARLVAGGKTNREIATNLFLSERTVEGHVDRIRNKLGFRTRTEIATWVVEHDLTDKEEEGPITGGPSSSANKRR